VSQDHIVHHMPEAGVFNKTIAMWKSVQSWAFWWYYPV